MFTLLPLGKDAVTLALSTKSFQCGINRFAFVYASFHYFTPSALKCRYRLYPPMVYAIVGLRSWLCEIIFYKGNNVKSFQKNSRLREKELSYQNARRKNLKSHKNCKYCKLHKSPALSLHYRIGIKAALRIRILFKIREKPVNL